MICWHRIKIIVSLLLLGVVGLLLFTYEWPAFGSEKYQLQAAIGSNQFDFAIWEAEAFAAKAEAILANGQSYLPAETRKEIVLHSMELAREIERLEERINRAYVDPDTADPDGATAALQAELTQKRQALKRIQPIAEAILQDQAAAVLADEGFAILGETWPPALAHMTPVPSLLVTSPRDRIERTNALTLVPGLSARERDEIETAVLDNLNLSALVVPLGGLATYPAMVQETGSLNWLAEVTAHEWSHHWMDFHPIGLNYNDPQVRVINETTASIFGKEIGGQIIQRYYPELVPPPPPDEPPETAAPDPDEPPPFDFTAEMYKTRLRVDELLAEGKVEEAEAYMEARRRFFVEHGYNIRKLNQAYFAFYRAYAAAPGGAAGEDPIGPMIREIRANSPTLHDFMENMASVSSFADLEAVRNRVVGD